jgi:hypothetical protein
VVARKNNTKNTSKLICKWQKINERTGRKGKKIKFLDNFATKKFSTLIIFCLRKKGFFKKNRGTKFC